MKFKYVNHDGGETISLIFTTGDLMPVTLSPTHKAWDKFKSILLSDNPEDLSEDEARSILVKNANVAQWVGKVSNDVSVTLYGVYFRGEPISGPIADTLSKMAREDASGDKVFAKALARFIEKADANPSIENSDQLYRWVINEGLTITPDGDFIGYKSVRDSGKTYPEDLQVPVGKHVYFSTYDGGAIVDGIDAPGYVPNFVGAVVEMPRDKVDPDGNVHCSVGLHVGTFKYAYNSYGGNVHNTLLIKVNPSDVVSVPRDYNFQKLRTCKYTVIGEGITSILDERLYIDEEFAPISDAGLSVDEEETIANIISRLKYASE